MVLLRYMQGIEYDKNQKLRKYPKSIKCVNIEKD